MAKRKGRAFEMLVADIQRRIDPNAEVFHDQRLVDRHGHRRQFDVVIRGNFAGQQLLGIIECKDLKKRVGTPEIDAFITKAQGVNANFKIFVSRNGFTGSAVEKCKHYGVQTLSLIPNDVTNHGFRVGNFWYASIFHWEEIALTLLFADETGEPLAFDAQDVSIGGKKVIDWFTNYLLSKHRDETKLGWVIGVRAPFEQKLAVHIGRNRFVMCSGIEFYAKRGCIKKQKFVGINGTGFFDWQGKKATLPAQKNIRTDAVSTDFMEWDDAEDEDGEITGFLAVRLLCHSAQFEHVADAIDLTKL